MLSTILSRVLFLSLVVALFSLTAQADPVLVSGSGSNIGTGAGVPWVFHFDFTAGNGSLAAYFWTAETSNPVEMGCCTQPGHPFFLDFNGSGSDVFGSMTAEGVTYPFPTVLGTIHIHAVPVLAPITPTSGSFHVTTPFEFTGSVTAFDSLNYIRPLASFSLIGGGVLDAEIASYPADFDPNNPLYVVRTVTYTFATPEPDSVLLLFSGLTYLSAFGLRRRFCKQ